MDWTFPRRALLVTAFVILMLHLFVYLYFSISLMRFPFDYDQGEGFELVATMYLSEGRSPYTDNSQYPYFSDLYPLGFHLPLVPFAWLFGAELWYGRLLSFLGTLLTAGAIGWAVRREGRRPDIAILFGLAFLASNYIYHIGPLFRQHYFMVMLETLGVVILAHYFEKPGRWRLWIGLGLLLWALYTKQLAYPTVAAVFIWLFIRRPRLAITSVIGFGAAGALIFGVLLLLTKGWWWDNAFAANLNPFLYGQFWGLAKQFVTLHWALLILAGLFAAYELYFTRLSLYTIWWVAATANTITAGKWGAGDSYFATSIAATCILAGIFTARTLNQAWTLPDNYLSRQFRPVLRRIPNTSLWGVAPLALLIIYSLSVIKMPTSGKFFAPISEALGVEPQIAYRYPLYDSADWTVGYALLGHLPSQTDVERGWAIVDRVKSTYLPVLSEDAMFNLLAGKAVIGNPVHLKNLYENDLFDPTDMVQDLENQRYGLLVLRASFYPAPVLAAIHDAYYPVEAIEMNGFQYQIWEPEPTWVARRQIRNYLEGTPTEPFSLDLPAEMGELSDWINRMMARWAWLPALEQSQPPASDCPSFAFIRREQRAILQVCGGKITIMPPEWLE